MIGNPLDTTIAGACLIFGGVLERYPKLNFVMVHGGGFIPYQGGRWVHGWHVRPEPKVHLKHSPEKYLDRFLYDTILHSKTSLEFLVSSVGADRVFLGSDYPYDMGTMECVRQVRALAIPEKDRAHDSRRSRRDVAVRRSRNDVGAVTVMDDSTNLLPTPATATRSLIEDSLVAAGLPQADAAQCAELMTEADLTGADGHGIFRLPQYVRRLKAGGFNARPNIVVKHTGPATALVDGDNGMGHLAVTRATNEAIAMARESGFVGRRAAFQSCRQRPLRRNGSHARNDQHLRRVANANRLPTWGGAELLLGTNPLAIGVPSGKGPLILDMATSIVAYGTVKKYALRGLTMPEGWFVNAETGSPITDPNRSGEGLLLPMGEYKGSGLAIMLGLLGGVLNNAAFGRDVVDFMRTIRPRPIPASS